MNNKTVVLVLSVFSFTACNHTPTGPDAATQPQPVNGALRPDSTPYYYLPAGQLTLEISRSLDCAKDTRQASINWEVAGTVKAIADTARPIPLSLKNFEHFGRDTAATLTFAEDGRITGVNIDSKDQIGPTISNIIVGVTKIGLALATLGALGFEDRQNLDGDGRYLCPEETAAIFDVARGITAQIQAAEKKRAEIVARLAKVAPGSPEHEEVTKELAALDKSTGQYKSELVKLLAPYEFDKKLELVPQMQVNGFELGIDTIPEKVLARWLGEGGTRPPSSGKLTITPQGSWGALPDAPDGTKLYVRMPAMADVKIIANCIIPTGTTSKECVLIENQREFGTATVYDKPLAMPQAGRLLAINLDAQLFRDKLINIETHPSGTLKTYGATEKSGLGAVSNTISGVQQSLDAYVAYRAARDAENSALNEVKDENAILEAQITNLENKKKLEALQAEQQTTESEEE